MVFAVSAFAAACKKDGHDGVTDVACAAGDVAGVTKVTWKTDLEGDAHVEYGLDEGELDTSSPGVSASDGAETLLGLKVATDYYVRVVVDADGEPVVSDTIECTTEPPPRSAPAFTVDTWNPDLACEDGGYVLFNWLGQEESGVGIVDRDGRYVWAVESDSQVQFARARLGRDGRSILWNTNDYNRVEDIATVERRSIDGSTNTSTRTLLAHHDFLELPDGKMAFLGYNFIMPADLEARGFDLAALGFPANGWTELEWAYDRIEEVPEGATDGDTPAVVFDMLDDWPQGVYFNHTGAFEKCDRFLPGRCDLGHGNSLAYVASEDRYTVGFRWLDALVNVERANGGVNWVLGGPESTLTGPADQLPMHAHFSDAWAGGMLVYDNRDNDPPTRLVEYTIDEAAGTFSVPWSYDKEAPEPDTVLGDVRRIPVDGCDNLLVSWASDGRLEERTRDGQIVWQVSLSLGNITGRAQYLSSLYDFADQAYPE